MPLFGVNANQVSSSTGADGGDGGDVTLDNVVGATTTGAITLNQIARGGVGGRYTGHGACR